MSSLLKSITLLLAITSFGNSSEICTSMSSAINGIEINAINSEEKENKLTLNLNAQEYIPIHLRNKSNNNVISNKYYPIYINLKLREQKIECLKNVINNWGNKEIVIYNLNKFINIIYKCEIYVSRNMLEKWIKNSNKILSESQKEKLNKMPNVTKQDKSTKNKTNIAFYEHNYKLREIFMNLFTNKVHYKFFDCENNERLLVGNRHIIDHLLLDSNHIFKDIGIKTMKNDDIINGINKMKYYNEIHEVVKLAYDKQTNTISKDYKQQIYDIIKYCLINPSINRFITDANHEYHSTITENKNISTYDKAVLAVSNSNGKYNNKLILVLRYINNTPKYPNGCITCSIASFFGINAIQKQKFEKYKQQRIRYLNHK